ncbi:MAG TPA: hypothetical protein VHG32_02945 [Thermoanaerobaculia bacterium]|jgi:hypothetical protein|nr:hypothetical protein [Thermoanaerobaculia bacterium]
MHGTSLRLGGGIGAVLIVVLTPSCVSSRKGIQSLSASHLAATATSYNLAIEQTQNEMLLLNVIRAMNHRPMYVTDASKVTGTVKLDLSLGSQIPTERTKDNKLTITPAIDYSTSPAMDVNLLNSQDFMNGFLKPTTQEVFAYYWDREWPSEFLLYLMALKVDVYAKSKYGKAGEEKWWLQCSLYNHPDVNDGELTKLKDFGRWVHNRVVKGRPTLMSSPAKSADIGPLWPPAPELPAKLPAPPPPCPNPCPPAVPAPPATFDVLVNIATATGLSLVPQYPKLELEQFQLRRDKQVYTLIAAPGTEGFACPPTELKTEGDGEVISWEDLTEGTANRIVMGSKKDATVFAVNLRSPEGLLYYLGQLARLEAGAANRPEGSAVAIHVSDYTSEQEPTVMPLFVALDKGRHACVGDRVLVRSLGQEDYFIPKKEAPKQGECPLGLIGDRSGLLLIKTAELCYSGRSMMSINLAAQLIGLQKPPASPPASASTVKAAGGSQAPAKSGKGGGGGSGGSQ